jgi:hypothetical protein
LEGTEKFAKIGEKKFFAETDFCKRIWGILQKSDRIFAKIVFFYPKTNFRKKIANILQCSAHYPHVERGSNPAF